MYSICLFLLLGSSPRVWGQEVFDVIDELMDGIIPTRVGTSETHKSERLERRDHPHACGDKRSLQSRQTARTGSSPRVWGQVYKSSRRCRANGIIPTRVGTSATFSAVVNEIWDHPHACGDKFVYTQKYQVMEGSSPRVWGQGSKKYETHAILGIIPTRVGTSLQITGAMAHRAGSSPRVWGQALTAQELHLSAGIIPTRVGTRTLCHI